MAADDLTRTQRNLVFISDVESRSGKAVWSSARSTSLKDGRSSPEVSLARNPLVTSRRFDLLALRDEGYLTLMRTKNGYTIALKPKAYTQSSLPPSPAVTRIDDVWASGSGSADFVHTITPLEEERDA